MDGVGCLPLLEGLRAIHQAFRLIVHVCADAPGKLTFHQSLYLEWKTIMAMESTSRPWETIAKIIVSKDTKRLGEFLNSLGTAEIARSISRLGPDDQSQLLTLLDPGEAADVVEEISDTQAVGLIGDLLPEQAAPIIDEIPSDRQADLLGELNQENAQAILDQMAPEEAADARQLLTYVPDSAGGIMVTEYLAFGLDQRISDAVEDLQVNREKYIDYDVQYAYVIDDQRHLVGVLRMRDLLFAPRQMALREVMNRNMLHVRADAPTEELERFFGQHHLFGVPVVDAQGCLVGVVQRGNVEHASANRANRQFLGFSGIVRGEEFRSMPILARSGRRLSWLSINIVLNIIAASVIAFYQDTLQAAITLAVFLPMISDMSGCSGNQAAAVSIRELTLGLIRPHELFRVLLKEAGVGILNGLVLGMLLGAVALLWKGNPYLGLVVGAALATNTIVAVVIGGLLPLIIKRLRFDPALVSGPLLTTVTDMCGFFLVLSFATAILSRLAQP